MLQQLVIHEFSQQFDTVIMACSMSRAPASSQTAAGTRLVGMGGKFGKLVGELQALMSAPGSGILLTGPTGSGKSAAAREAARRLGVDVRDLLIDSLASARKLSMCASASLTEDGGYTNSWNLVSGLECLDGARRNSVLQELFKALPRCIVTAIDATGLRADRHVWSHGFSWDELAEAVRAVDGRRLLTFQDMVLLRKSEDLNHGDIRRVVVAAQTLCMVRQHGFSPQQFPASDVVVDSDLHVWRHAQRFILGNRVGALQDYQIEPCKEWIQCNLVSNLCLGDAADFADTMCRRDALVSGVWHAGAAYAEVEVGISIGTSMLQSLGVQLKRTRAFAWNRKLIPPKSLTLQPQEATTRLQ